MLTKQYPLGSLFGLQHAAYGSAFLGLTLLWAVLGAVAWFLLDQDGRTFRIKVHQCELAEGRGKPGEVIDGELTIACGEGAVRLLSLQREGKSAMGSKEFQRGFSVPKGVVVG